MKEIFLVFALNESIAKKFAIGARKENPSTGFLVRGIRSFVDAQSDINGIIMLDQSNKVEAAYEQLNEALEQKAEEHGEELKQIKIIRRYDKSDDVKKEDPGCLIGSDAFPAEVGITMDATITLGDLVAMAHAGSGLEIREWNELEQEQRDEALNATLAKLQAGARAELIVKAKELIGADKQPAEEAKALAKALGGGDLKKDDAIAYLNTQINEGQDGTDSSSSSE